MELDGWDNRGRCGMLMQRRPEKIATCTITMLVQVHLEIIIIMNVIAVI